MKISTHTGAIAELVGEEKAVELIAKAGFDAWDFSLFGMARMDWANNCVFDRDHPLRNGDYLGFSRKMRKIGEEFGIVCNQSHAPFPSFVPETRTYLKRAIECTAEAGGEICIIHPGNSQTVEENKELYLELLPFAKSCGVKIATENMWNWDEEKDQACFASCATAESFKAHFDAVNDEDFVACLDIGHAEMKGLGTNAVDLVHALGDKLQALHIHDNDKWHDSHCIPGTMQIDFPPIVKALKEIGYSGYFTAEVDYYLDGYTPETALDGVKKLADAMKKLADMFENA